jgi:SAM-dependent methyltransferase
MNEDLVYPIVWKPLTEELSPFLKHVKGIVLNAGAGQRDLKLGQREIGIDIVPDTKPDIVGDLHAIPLLDESIDSIVSIAVLEHTKYAWIVAKEFYRVLRPGGSGVIAVPFLQPQHACPDDYVRFTEAGLVELMKYIGFEIIETAHVHHFGQTLAWLLWEYIIVNRPKNKFVLQFWLKIINRLSTQKIKLFNSDSPNTHNTHYVVVRKPGNPQAPRINSSLDELLADPSKTWFAPLLACPNTRQPISLQGDAYVAQDGSYSYPMIQGSPHLLPRPDLHLNPPSQPQKFAARKNSAPIAPEPSRPLIPVASVIPKIISEASLKVNFRSKFLEKFQGINAEKIAILATNEYEGIFKNGGVGTHYKTQDGWYVILLLCNTEQTFGGQSTISAVRNIFSTAEITQSLDLQPVHATTLQSIGHLSFDGQSYCCLLFTQAIANCFKNSKIYVEFHEMCGIGYYTIQAKRAKLLSDNCITAVTMHSGHEWVYEANEWYAEFCNPWFQQICDYEKYTFENADLAFFPSYHLKSRVEAYGWKTSHAKHMPYFVPIVPNYNVLDLVGMTSPEERQYVEQYARQTYTGKGEIVDLGCWLGSLTVPLAIGLQNNSQVKLDHPCVHAYDIFQWADWMNRCVAKTPLQNKYKPGDSFIEEFTRQVKPWENLIKVYAGDLNKIGWQPNLPIEFLMVDAMKSWDETNSIIRDFFPSLIPGVSLMVQQDFVHSLVPWIHLIMYRLKDYFEPVQYVPNSSMVFRYLRPLPPELVNTYYYFQLFSDEEIEAACQYSMSLVPHHERPNIAASKAAIQFYLQNYERARQEIQIAKDQGLYSESSLFKVVENMLLEVT